MVNPKRTFSALALAAAVVLSAGVAANAASAKAAPSDPPTTSATPSYYVSLGDSYAAGWQAYGRGKGRTTDHGFVYQTLAKSRTKGYDMTMVNYGCAGATTTSVLKTVGCPAPLLGPWGTAYPDQTQAAAAEAFLQAHQGQVGLVTVSIGGNDVTKCAAAANIVSCLGTALSTMKTNLTKLMTDLRAAAGPDTLIVGTTYPDVLLGDWLSKDPKVQQLAAVSVAAFKSLINPTLQGAYTGAGGKFVDVTDATGGYIPTKLRMTYAPYGKIPVSVAKICKFTYYCQYQDIHPRTNGYSIISDLVVATLPTPSG